MGRKKLTKFAETLTFPNFFQPSRDEVFTQGFQWKGRWKDFFKNNNPIVLELCCGRGEYTIGLAKMFPEKNFIGIDRKGARMWQGCKYSIENQMTNVAFLRMQIEMVNHYFAPDEVSEIWITFPDPQPKKVNKRMTSPLFLDRYKQILSPEGTVNLKTDSPLMYEYTLEIIKKMQYRISQNIEDIYVLPQIAEHLKIRTYYENMWIDKGLTIRYLQFLLHQ